MGSYKCKRSKLYYQAVRLSGTRVGQKITPGERENGFSNRRLFAGKINSVGDIYWRKLLVIEYSFLVNDFI